jgi:hypothetical protein
MHRLAIAFLAALLAACAAPTGPTGPPFAEHASRAGAVAPEMARLYVFWPTTDSKRLLAARLMIDGTGVDSCEYGGFNGYDVPAGTHVLAVDREDLPGRCEVRVDASGGSTYFWQLALRTSYQAAGMPGALIGSIPFPPLIAIGIALMISGVAIESSGKECGGPYSITPVDETAALPRISGLRKSK